jgi:polyhydroxyalkanoate synthesis regulator phasin
MTADEAKRLVDTVLEQRRQIVADLEAEVTRLETVLPKIRAQLERVRASGLASQEGEV